MIHVLTTWVPVGAALGLLLIGVGLLLDRVSETRIPSALILPLGLCTVIVAGELWSAVGLPVKLLALLSVAAALAGLWFGRARRLSRAGWWGVAAALATWVIYTLVVALTGQTTFPGYGILADPAIHLVGSDALPGPPGDWAHQTGAFKSFFEGYYDTGYPEGGASTLGLLNTLTGLDPVRTLYPLVVMAMAALTASVWSMLGPVITRPWARALAAVVAAVPALTFNFVLQSSLKEVLEIAVIATLFASTGALLAGRATTASDPADGDPAPNAWRSLARDALVPAVAVGAAVASIGLAAAIYIVPGAVIVLAGLLLRGGLRRSVGVVFWVGVFAVIFIVPSLVGLGSYLDVSGSVLTSQNELGNLYAGPLLFREIWGVWLNNDFRTLPVNLNKTTHAADVIVALVILGSLRVLVAPLARRAQPAIPLLAWGVAVAVATPIVINVGSPWADAKAMVIAGPTIMALAAAGVWWLTTSRWLRVPAVVLGALALAGVAASAGLAAYQVGVAPQARFDELSRIDDRFAGQGPMADPEFEEFSRHLLRKVPGTFASDPYLGISTRAQYGASGDSDDLSQAALQGFKLLLVRKGAATSRPPSNFERRWSGRYYEVWARNAAAPAPRLHLGLGGIASGGTEVTTCSRLERFAKRARPGEQLVAAVRPEPTSLPFGKLPLPVAWGVDGSDPRLTYPYGSARFEFTLDAKVAAGAPVDVWLEGSFTRKVTVVANGVTGTIGPMALNPRYSGTHVVTTKADARGKVHVVVTRPSKALRTGWGNLRALWGPVSVTPHDPLAGERIQKVSPDDVRSLCGPSLDWIELVPAS